MLVERLQNALQPAPAGRSVGRLAERGEISRMTYVCMLIFNTLTKHSNTSSTWIWSHFRGWIRLDANDTVRSGAGMVASVVLSVCANLCTFITAWHWQSVKYVRIFEILATDNDDDESDERKCSRIFGRSAHTHTIRAVLQHFLWSVPFVTKFKC